MTIRNALTLAAITALWPLMTGCDPDPLQGHFVDPSPRERYAEALDEAGLAGTALARDWIAAGQRALVQAPTVEVPYREEGYLDPAEPRAEAYRVELQEGQRLNAEVVMATDGGRLFIDLFVLSADSVRRPVLLAAADSLARSLEYVARRDGAYLLRIQPELLRGGRYGLSVDVSASLEFPVIGHDTRAIRSQFGAPRDGGRRRHHGIDIFAARGTPVIAASSGRVSWVGTNRLGGNVVWLRERHAGYALYYAHLDSQAVRRGRLVNPGDTLGFVGNTGNARGTPPHLHFGIYLRGRGPVDPNPFLERSSGTLSRLTADTAALGDWVRTARDGIRLRWAPSRKADVVSELARHTTLRVLAATGSWYRITLPSGTRGFVAADLTESAASPVGVTRANGSLVLRSPQPSAVPVDSVATGRELPVRGVFGTFAFVTTPSGRKGWVEVGQSATR